MGELDRQRIVQPELGPEPGDGFGIGPLASAKQARWMHENLWGVSIPEPIIKRLDGAADQKAEGRKICAELIQELATIKGVAGAHLMAPRQEAEMAASIAESGILGRRETRPSAARA